MSNFNNVDLLELAELYAADNGLISSESELSERFDEEVAPSVIEQYGEKGVEFSDDAAMNEAFNNWSNTLADEGELHAEQYSSYIYVGEWA